MITVDDIEKSPAGIGYLTTGTCKSHILEIVRELGLILGNRGESMSDEEFKTYTGNKLDEIVTQIGELYAGMNKLYDMINGVK